MEKEDFLRDMVATLETYEQGAVTISDGSTINVLTVDDFRGGKLGKIYMCSYLGEKEYRDSKQIIKEIYEAINSDGLKVVSVEDIG